MELMNLFYPPFTPPNIPGRIHLLKDEPDSKLTEAMKARWANIKRKDVLAPKRDAIVRCFKTSGWITVAKVSKKIKMHESYVQRIAAQLHRAGILERQIADSAKRTYEYRAKDL